MKPNFYARNLVVNALIALLEKDFVLSYYEKTSGEGQGSLIDLTDFDVDHYNELLPLLESEINQTIFSNNVHYIRTFFEELKEKRQYFRSIGKEDVLSWVAEWNQEWYKEYEKKIEEQTDKYRANEKTKGLKHLDTYKDIRYVGPGFFPPPMSEYRDRDWKEIELIYYEFYCIDDITQKWAKYIDPSGLQPYYKLIVGEMTKFVNLVDKYIERYEAGEYISPKSEDTWVDKQIKRFKNNKFSGVIILIVLAVSAPYGIIRLGMDIYKAANEEEIIPSDVMPVKQDTASVVELTLSGKPQVVLKSDSITVDSNKKENGN